MTQALHSHHLSPKNGKQHVSLHQMIAFDLFTEEDVFSAVASDHELHSTERSDINPFLTDGFSFRVK